jgi:predicted component of type VI protein secretion system
MDVTAMAQRRGQPLPGPAVRPVALSLVGMNAPFASQRFPLKAEVTTVGRAPENDIVLNDPSVSALHAKIVHERGEWRVINLLSTNGTFVNGQRCTSAAIQAGYRLRFGNTDFLISGQAPTAATAATAPTSTPMRPWMMFVIALLASLTTAALLLLFWWLY